MNVAQYCRDRRKELGLTQEAVARAANVTLSTVIRFEGGKFGRQGPRFSTLNAMERALQLNPGALRELVDA